MAATQTSICNGGFSVRQPLGLCFLDDSGPALVAKAVEDLRGEQSL
jgi:hypothetical protein